nr:hypothetical protein [uncultured Rhodoferax sp.]
MSKLKISILAIHLVPYQSQYIAWLLSRRMGADSADLLADDMGWGQTLEARLDGGTQIAAVLTIQWSLQ